MQPKTRLLPRPRVVKEGFAPTLPEPGRGAESARGDSRRPSAEAGILPRGQLTTATVPSAEASKGCQPTPETLRRLLDVGVFGYATRKADGTILDANRYFLDLIGRTKDELGRGEVFRAETPCEWLSADGEALTELVERGSCSPYEKEFFRQDGSRVPVLVAEAALPGSEDAIVTFAVDLSETKKAQAALAASAEALHSSIDALVDPFLMCSSIRDNADRIRGFRVDFANRPVGQYMGLTSQELLGRALPEEAMALEEIPFGKIVRQVVESGAEWRREAAPFVLAGREGKPIVGRANVQIAKYADGFFAVWRNVTDPENAIATLRASEHRARELFENSADGILISNAQGAYIEANPAMCRMVGYTREELLGMKAGDLTADDDPIGNEAMTRRVKEQAAFVAERRYKRRDGTSVAVEVRFSRLSGGRQQRNVRDISERLAAEAIEARETRIRAALTQALQRVPADGTIEETSQTICDVLKTLPGVDFAALCAFVGKDEVMVLAGRLPATFPTRRGESFPADRAHEIQARAPDGPWALDRARLVEWGSWGAAAIDAGLEAVVFGPVVSCDQVAGVLLVGTADRSYAPTMVQRKPGLVAFTAATSGLLGERLLVLRREAELEHHIRQILENGSFHPVFQPIVDLATRAIVGFEALTRFDSGQSPDRCLADAWSVGLGPDLELASLDSATVAARRLPSGRWLDVNVSPRLLGSLDQLRTLLWSSERPIVIEITEHEVISDYNFVREAIRALGHDVRLAVDDAGAGAANFGHIVELRPDLVKLDISLVRRVNGSLGRQALVVGMRHFSRSAGCRLVAEGIETEEEAATLRDLGVEFGQGYLYGRPEPVEFWLASKPLL